MNRRHFVRDCTLGACACTAASALAPIASLAVDNAPAPQEDWRIRFVQSRYAKLIGILSQRLGEAELAATLQSLGRRCAEGLPQLNDHPGDVDGFITDFCVKSGENIAHDRERGVITVVGPERTACFCPLVDTHNCPKIVCDCSLGWQKQVYETLLGRPVEVALKESVVRGGKRCVFEVRIRPAPVG
ncbi:MAG: hypothetical protein QM691_02410 [Opitutaceae bacterium]